MSVCYCIVADVHASLSSGTGAPQRTISTATATAFLAGTGKDGTVKQNPRPPISPVGQDRADTLSKLLSKT